MFPEDVPDLSAFSEPGLFALYRAILSELKHRGVIRTENAPVGDYAEYLVAIGSGAGLEQAAGGAAASCLMPGRLVLSQLSPVTCGRYRRTS